MNIRYILLAATAMFAAGCSQNEPIMSGELQQEVRVTAGAGPGSRITLNDGGDYTRTLWQKGDKITLFTSTQRNLVYSTSIDSTSTTADFTPTGEALKYIEGNTVYAGYPEVSAVTEDGMTVSLPSSGTLVYDNGTLRSFAYAVGSISKGSVNFTFKHISAFLCLTLTPDMLASAANNVVGGVTVSTSSSTPLSVGEWDTFDFTTLTANTTSGGNTVQVLVDGGRTVDSNWTLYIPILPQPADATITITITGTDGTTLYTQSKQAPSAGFLAGKVYMLNFNDSTTVADSRQLVGVHLTYDSGTDYFNEDYTISYGADGKVEEVNVLIIDSIYGYTEKNLLTFEYSDEDKSLKATYTGDTEYGYTLTASLNDMGFFEKVFSKYATDDETGETFLFEYNSMGSITRYEESLVVYTMEYDSNNNAIQCVSEDEHSVTTNNIVYGNVENKGNILLVDLMFGSDFEDHLDFYSLLGFMGNSSTHLPIQINKTYSDDDSTYTIDFEWTIDDDGYPTKVIVKKDRDVTYNVVFTWSSESR